MTFSVKRDECPRCKLQVASRRPGNSASGESDLTSDQKLLKAARVAGTKMLDRKSSPNESTMSLKAEDLAAQQETKRQRKKNVSTIITMAFNSGKHEPVIAEPDDDADFLAELTEPGDESDQSTNLSPNASFEPPTAIRNIFDQINKANGEDEGEGSFDDLKIAWELEDGAELDESGQRLPVVESPLDVDFSDLVSNKDEEPLASPSSAWNPKREK